MQLGPGARPTHLHHHLHHHHHHNSSPQPTPRSRTTSSADLPTLHLSRPPSTPGSPAVLHPSDLQESDVVELVDMALASIRPLVGFARDMYYKVGGWGD